MDMSKNSDKLCGSIACRPTDDMDIHLCLHSGPDSVAESHIPLVALDETLHECSIFICRPQSYITGSNWSSRGSTPFLIFLIFDNSEEGGWVEGRRLGGGDVVA